MGAYNVVNRASMQAGQAEDISVVLANLDAIAAVINGGLDNSNIAGGAGIVYSKLNLANSIARGDMVAGFKTTFSTLAGGPPGSPTTGDVWVASAAGSTDEMWVFIYNGSSGSANKWAFIGGSEIVVEVDTQESTPADNTWGNLTTNGPLYTAPRNGDYIVKACARGICSASSQHQLLMGVAIGDTTPTKLSGATLIFSNAINGLAEVSVETRLMGVVAGNVIKMRYLVSDHTNDFFAFRTLSVLPLRII